MAETAVSIARNLVGSALSMAASAAAEEISLLLGVQDDIWFIKYELSMMEALLRAANAAHKTNAMMEAWVKQVRELAYDIEDCLQEFDLLVASQPHQLRKLGARHQVAIQIRKLKSRIQELGERNLRYKFIEDMASSSDNVASQMELTPALYVPESQIVGLDGPKDKLIKMINNEGEAAMHVVCVEGPGGLGKTTLVRKVYDSSDLASRFECRAWITVSQSFNIMDLFKAMIQKFLGDESLKQLLEKPGVIKVETVTDHLVNNLREKKYLLFLDDLWEVGHWDRIKLALPMENNKYSRVVVTTRNTGLSRHCTSPQHVHSLQPLNDEESRELLNKINKSHDELKKQEDLVKKILKKCRGLPLAILTIGSLLASKPSKEWKDLYEHLPSELDNNPILEVMKRVVIIGYNNLPYHLKPCFLYLSIFPEDFEIKRKRIVNRWIAEGYVRGRIGMAVEEVAKEYFYELVNRSMILPSKVDINGRIKSCRVHDIMRDVMISISREENLSFSISEHNTVAPPDNVRHLSFLVGKNLQGASKSNFSRVRSLTVFDELGESLASLCSFRLKMLRVVDLENVGYPFVTPHDIKNIGQLIHLKYLNLKNAGVYTLPRSVKNLQALEVLDIRGTGIVSIPNEVLKLQRLKVLRCFNTDARGSLLERCLGCLYLPKVAIDALYEFPHQRDRFAAIDQHLAAVFSPPFGYSWGVRVPNGIGKLKGLQELDLVDIAQSGSKVIEELGKLTQLRKLGVTGVNEKNGKKLSTAISDNLTMLRSLSVDTYEDSGTLVGLHSVSSPPLLLQKLTFGGHLGKFPSWIAPLENLVKIKLRRTDLEEGEVTQVLGGLPNLISVHLLQESYIGRMLVFQKGTFRTLKLLELEGLRALEGLKFVGDFDKDLQWLRFEEYFEEDLQRSAFEEHTLPCLERISIKWCDLYYGICGISRLLMLKEISVHGHNVASAELAKLRTEVDEHPNNPILEWRFS